MTKVRAFYGMSEFQLEFAVQTVNIKYIYRAKWTGALLEAIGFWGQN